IELIPEAFENRVSEHGIRIFYRQYTNEGYTELSPDQCVVNKSFTGRLIILLKSTVRAWEIKIHSNYDDRDIETGETINVAEFSNDLNKMIRVYGRYDRTTIEYDYDSVGNRTKETYTDLNYHYNVSYSYDYYDGSNRLKNRESQEVRDWISSTDNVDGFMKIGVGDKKAYQYDKAGNMVAKGNSYSFNGNSVDYIAKEGEDTSYWKYGYNAKNRLTDVWKNGEDDDSHIAKYGYDYRGLRVRVEEGDAVSYHVYNYFGQLVYEEQGDEETFYIYALGRVIAKREGKNGEEEKVYYYHHDNLGSTVLMTDGEGEVVFEQNYAPFGQDLYKAGTYEKPPYDVEAGMKYTGQIADVDTGLYYYNARYYDPEIGRFNREDPAKQGDNWYIYTSNNPLNRLDPTGLEWVFDQETWEWTATEETDVLWKFAEKVGFDSWQEAAEYAGISNWYDEEGNWIGGSNTLMGMKIKAPLDIYTADFTGFSVTLLELGFGEKESTIAISGAASDVFVENSRTNDAFFTQLISYVKESGQVGIALPSLGGSISTLYGAFPRHYSDFLRNEKHRNEIYYSLLGECTVRFLNFGIGSFAWIKAERWRGKGGGVGLKSFKINVTTHLLT
ncbi:MAG: RHS repeat-associated core domain-containing protein, partial [Halanaerobiales bacterium]|nr:RHS repeat-associated core domain-containing protein [Halanaerobiales bacterium]